MCTQVRTLKDNLPLSFILPIKHNLWYVADSYISNRPDFENRLLYEQNMYEKTGEKGYAILLREAVDTVGEEKTLREIQIYLKNGKDSRSPEEFFEALKGDGK